MDKIKIFKYIAWLEGLSFLVLLFIAMPLKYMWGNPWMVQKVGMAHGVLFMAYVYAAFWVRNLLVWNNKQFFRALVLSVIPFGTFFVFSRRSAVNGQQS